jgi:hypothetical protein
MVCFFLRPNNRHWKDLLEAATSSAECFTYQKKKKKKKKQAQLSVLKLCMGC